MPRWIAIHFLNLMNIQHFILMCFFLLPSSVTLSSFPTQALSHLSPLLNSCSCTPRVSHYAKPIFSWSSILPMNSISVWFQSYCQVCYFLFLCHSFIVVFNPSFKLPTFVKCRMGYHCVHRGSINLRFAVWGWMK